MWLSAILASSLTITMSAACISSKPPAIATPSTAATTGTSTVADEITCPAEGVEQRPQRFGPSGSEALDLGDIASGAEVFARPANDDHVHRRIRGQLAQRVFELAGQFDRHRVHALGPVQRDVTDAVGDRVLHDAHV